jgi:hypothetical protein
MSEYITLPSNVSSCEGNTIAMYKTVLAVPKELKGKWKVGLAKISFTKSWYNLREDSPLILMDSRGQVFKSTVPAGYYETEKQLTEVIETSITEALARLTDNWKVTVPDRPQVIFNQYSRRVSTIAGYTSDFRDIYLIFEGELEQMLGLTNEGSFYKIDNADTMVIINQKDIKGSTEPPSNYDLKAGIHSLFVYCNIAEPVAVGDSYRQLLATVGVPSKARFGSQVEERYDNPFYIPVGTNSFQNIDIAIFDDNGKVIPFKFGRVIITLHLKKDVR